MAVKNIAQTIVDNKKIGKEAYFSSQDEIDSFFEDMPKEINSAWPLNLSAEGFTTEYYSAAILHKQAGFIKSLHIKSSIKNDMSEYLTAVGFDYDFERLDIEIESLYKEKGKNGFTNLFISKMKHFIAKYDVAAKNSRRNASELKVHAKSGFYEKSNLNLYGGYFWANQGFDFDDYYKIKELANMREEFKAFCLEKDIKIGKKELNLFTKPCHFAAFDCGVKVEVGNGKFIHLGKAFMSTQSWHGKWSINDIDSTQERYAKEYNSDITSIALRRKNAVITLGSSYLKMLKKHAKENNGRTVVTMEKTYFSKGLKLMKSKFSGIMK